METSVISAIFLIISLEGSIGYYIHNWTKLVGKTGLVFMVKVKAIDKILKLTSLKLEDSFNHTERDNGWVAVFVKTRP